MEISWGCLGLKSYFKLSFRERHKTSHLTSSSEVWFYTNNNKKHRVHTYTVKAVTINKVNNTWMHKPNLINTNSRSGFQKLICVTESRRETKKEATESWADGETTTRKGWYETGHQWDEEALCISSSSHQNICFPSFKSVWCSFTAEYLQSNNSYCLLFSSIMLVYFFLQFPEQIQPQHKKNGSSSFSNRSQFSLVLRKIVLNQTKLV